MKKAEGMNLRRLVGYYCYLLLVWGFFRLLVKFPDLIEELWFKPLIWLLPLLWMWVGEKRRIKFFAGSMKEALIWGIGLGVMYVLVALAAGAGKYGGLSEIKVGGDLEGWVDAVGIGLATAITEELVFSGYVFQRMKELLGNLWSAMGVTAVMFAAIHIPISVFVYKYSAFEMTGFLALVLVVSLGNYWIMGKTKNVIAPILSHWLWGVAIFLFG